jgi:hypothetical protein
LIRNDINGDFLDRCINNLEREKTIVLSSLWTDGCGVSTYPMPFFILCQHGLQKIIFAKEFLKFNGVLRERYLRKSQQYQVSSDHMSQKYIERLATFRADDLFQCNLDFNRMKIKVC